jgi:mono/diheme cytochrome c family protein
MLARMQRSLFPASKGASRARIRRHSGAVLFIMILAAAVLAAGAFLALAWHPAIEPVSASAPAQFPAQQVHRGQLLAAIGNCASCHTTRDGGSFAGGVGVQTKFGNIYGTNITPDAQTGIGAWTLDAFRRALRQGVSRDGHLLYPAFPYDHFTHLADDDIAALYAFLMTRDPVHATAPANHLSFPLQFRPLMAAWNLLYLKQGPIAQQPSQDPQLARGAYLVESLAHCAACHSPRNALGAEKHDAYLAGGEAEGWHATALHGNSPSPVPWSAQALAAYLRSGFVADHAITAGPMQDVVQNIAHADEADVQAIAKYIYTNMGPPGAQHLARETASRNKAAAPLAAVQPATQANADDATLALGATVYAGSCASCHDAGRGLSSDSAVQLPLAVALHLPDPRNLIHIIREGITPPDGQAGRWMPPFQGAFSDEELTALVIWLRRQGTDAPPWLDVARVVKESGEAP